MSGIDVVKKKALDLIGDVGKAALATLFPNDFEIYLCSIELVTSKGKTIDFFTFPVMPDSIQKVETKRNSVKMTAGGITTLSSPIYAPSEINIKGNFGRTFKILISENESVDGAAYSIKAGKYSLYQIGSRKVPTISAPAFDINIKNGFGAAKILQAIVSKSNGVDKDGKPFRLYFYNMALGENYMVVIPPNGISFSQNVNKNMIWEYNINMTVIAPLEAVKDQGSITSLVKRLAAAEIQKSINELATTVAGIL